MSCSELVQTVEDCYLDMFKELNLEVHELSGIEFSGTNTPNLFLNGVFNLKKDQINPPVMRKINDFFIRKNLSFGWFCIGDSFIEKESQDLFSSMGFTYEGEFPGMALDLQNFSCVQRNPNLEIKIITSLEEFSQWAEVLGASFQFDSLTEKKYSQLFKEKTDCFDSVMAFQDGKPIATGSIFASKDIARMYNVAVDPEYRNQGIGSAVSAFLIKKAQDKGCKQVVLVSSPMAEKAYKRLGFEKLVSFHFFSFK